FDSEPEYQRFLAGSLVKDGITYNMDDMSQTEVLVTVRGRILEAEREINGVTEKYLQVEAKDSPVTLNGMLSYESDSPLLLEPARNLSGTANNGVQVSGDGTLKVINSITVWKYSWKIAATTGQVFTLGGADDNVTGKKELQVALGGAGFLIQSVGGFLVDLKYGVLTAKKEGDIMVHAVGFGGSISIPIKDPTKKKPTSDPNDEEDYGDIMQNMFDENSEENQKARLSKDTHFSDGNLTAAINDVLFGERLNDAKTDIEDTGFIGISVELELGLPEDILGDLIKNVGGIYAHVIINTIENEYSLTAGLKIKLIECEGTLAFKETEVAGKDVIVPDRIAFYIRDGLKIPLAPPLFMTGLGGGISNLADTIGGEFDKLPPITLDLFTRLSAFETMIGDFTLQASLYGISLEGDMKFKHSEAVFKITAGINARWIDPWHLYMYGKASVIKGLLQGTLSIVISENAFGGYAALAVVIPEEIPFVGGKEVAGVEFAINNKFVGGNIKIIGIKFGVIYYWSGDFDFGEGIDLTLMESAYPDAMDIQSGETEDGGKYVAVYGSNIHKLASSKGLRLMDGGSNSVTVVNPAAQDSLLFEAEFLGAAPEISDLTFTAGGQNIPLVEDDGNGGGNCVIQTRPEGTYIYISITNTSGMAANTVFTLTTSYTNRCSPCTITI
ncbi:MAG: hypothetical protein II689_03330, partial [Firmicutes bacterium]|nr:hypothetical protein [Bacillota bacterium]